MRTLSAREDRTICCNTQASPASPSQKPGQSGNGRITRAYTRKRAKGGVIVEFALSCSLFFLLIFMILDFAVYGFVNLTMQHAVREGARYAVTGQSTLDPQGLSDRKRAVIQKIKESSMGLFDDVMTESDIVVTDSDGNVLSDFGSSGDTIVITLNCEWPIISPFTQAIVGSGDYTFSVGASMRNEAF